MSAEEQNFLASKARSEARMAALETELAPQAELVRSDAKTSARVAKREWRLEQKDTDA